MKLVCTILSFFIISASFAFTEPVESVLYKGKLGSHDILLYIGKGEGCGGEDYFYSGMYSYDGGKHWLLLNVTHNMKGFYCMVEHKFTGVLLLTEKSGMLEGTWQSYNREKTLDVKITPEKVSGKRSKELFDAWDKLSYEKNDC